MNVPPAPDITDHLPIALRAFAGPQFVELKEPRTSPPRRKRSKVAASPWTLIFDTETTTDAGQALRFGTYQVRRAGELFGGGIFYEPSTVTAAELETLRSYAESAGLTLLTRDEFAERIFYGIGYACRATIVGFNLPFDISRIAIRHGSARNEMRGGFSFALSDNPYQPHVRVRHISQRSAFIRFAGLPKQSDSRSQRRRGEKTPFRAGHFVDVKTLAGSIFARSFSLAGLCRLLNVPNPKLEFDEFEGPITTGMVRYAVRDVQATWECYADLVSRYAAFGITSTPPEKVYSEASIGKGNLRDMGIVPWQKIQPDFPRQILATIMGSYFGGRSEVRIRRELRQVMLCDFLSMYPTVCTLMGLWRFVIAEGMTWRDATADARELLASIDVVDLKENPVWRQLPVLVRVRPSADIFPVRASYSGEAQPTIGLNPLSSDQPLWFTLADCIAAKLLSGKPPQVVEAVAFAPGPIQSGLLPIKISGKEEYAVDPVNDDFYRRLIELRHSIKVRRDKADPNEREALEIEQNAIKIAANSTSYGVFAEINVADKAQPISLTVHSGTDDPFSFRSERVEEPGPFFHPLVATLIAGAARLMLAITERLVTEAQLEWAFCDTDSMAIAKPAAMAEPEFRDRVQDIVNWFEALNPYSFGGSILKIEDVNSRIGGVEFLPLYCWAVSAKRYCLFNLDEGGKPILRKASAHGLGHLRAPYGKDDPAGIPAPQVDLGPMKLELWHHDLWWQIVSAALAGAPDRIDLGYHPALNAPAVSRYAATTPELLRWFSGYNQGRSYTDQVKPFGFLLAMTANPVEPVELIGGGRRGRKPTPKLPKPIAPFDGDFVKAAAAAFDRETGAPVSPAALKSYRQALAQYHLRPESKFLNADFAERGTTLRRHVRAIGIRHIGKEANRWEEQFFVGLDRGAAPDYGCSAADLAAFADELRSIANMLGRQSVADLTGLSAAKVRRALAGSNPILSSLLGNPALPKLRGLARSRRSRELGKLRTLENGVEKMGLRGAARLHGLDPSNLRRLLGTLRQSLCSCGNAGEKSLSLDALSRSKGIAAAPEAH
jgi:hypothetical protein